MDVTGAAGDHKVMDHRLVMITGSGPGAGKSTLAGRLGRELDRRGESVRLWPEGALFEWPELAGLADRFRSRNYPSAADLISAFEHVVGAAEADTVWVQDWSWHDLAEDLPWAGDLEELCEFSRRMCSTAAGLHPIVLYLEADITAGLERAVRQRGVRWLARTRDALTPGTSRGRTIEDVATAYTARERRIRQSIEAGGWPVVTIRVTATADRVFTEALSAVKPSA